MGPYNSAHTVEMDAAIPGSNNNIFVSYMGVELI